MNVSFNWSSDWRIFAGGLLLAFILGIVLTLILKKRVKLVTYKLTQNVLLLKKYWAFIAPYVLLTTLGYILLWNLSPTDDRAIYIDIYNHATGLIFAIFVGYFTFLQVVESRLDKLKEEAVKYVHEKNYLRAIDYLEKCFNIDNDDFGIGASLAEYYLIVDRINAFNDKIDILKTKKRYPEDEVRFFYLIFAKDLLNESIGSAKQTLKTLIDYIKSNPHALKHFYWNFGDVQDSDKFKSLASGSQKIYNNLSRYLLRQLSEEDKVKFESENYELTTPSSTSPSAR